LRWCSSKEGRREGGRERRAEHRIQCHPSPSLLPSFFRYHVSAAEAWAPLAQQLLDEYGDDDDDEEAFTLEV